MRKRTEGPHPHQPSAHLFAGSTARLEQPPALTRDFPQTEPTTTIWSSRNPKKETNFRPPCSYHHLAEESATRKSMTNLHCQGQTSRKSIASTTNSLQEILPSPSSVCQEKKEGGSKSLVSLDPSESYPSSVSGARQCHNRPQTSRE